MIDMLIFTLTLGFVWGGWRQGVWKDMLHFVLWLSVGSLMALVLVHTLDPAQVEPTEAFAIVKQLLTLFGVAYIMMLLVEKFVIVPALFGPGRHTPTEMSRFLGAFFGGMKTVLVLFSGTFLFQMYSQMAEPELPPLLGGSLFVQSSYSFSADLYEYLTDEGVLDYNKIIWEEVPEEGQSALEKLQAEGFF